MHEPVNGPAHPAGSLGEDLSPFAEALRALRVNRGLRQEDLAQQLGCDRGRISALENDQREAVAAEFVHQLMDALTLTVNESADLLEAMRTSQRTYVVPAEAPPKAYLLVRTLFDRLDRMPDVQIEALLSVLRSYSPEAWPGTPSARHRVWRKDKLWKEESVP